MTICWKTSSQSKIETKRIVYETKFCFQNKTETKQTVSETKFFVFQTKFCFQIKCETKQIVSETKFCFQNKTETKQIVFETKFCFINKLWQTFSPRLGRPAAKKCLEGGGSSVFTLVRRKFWFRYSTY